MLIIIEIDISESIIGEGGPAKFVGGIIDLLIFKNKFFYFYLSFPIIFESIYNELININKASNFILWSNLSRINKASNFIFGTNLPRYWKTINI